MSTQKKHDYYKKTLLKVKTLLILSEDWAKYLPQPNALNSHAQPKTGPKTPGLRSGPSSGRPSGYRDLCGLDSCPAFSSCLCFFEDTSGLTVATWRMAAYCPGLLKLWNLQRFQDFPGENLQLATSTAHLPGTKRLTWIPMPKWGHFSFNLNEGRFSHAYRPPSST